ncbi:hypothetical protein EJB05_49046, partial [Eragrostis curvula]
MAAAADAVVVVPPPQPEPRHGRRSDIAAAKAVMYLCLASLWVCCACLAAVALGRHICDTGCPAVSAGAAHLAALLIPVFFLMLLRAMRAMGCGLDAGDKSEAGKFYYIEKNVYSVHKFIFTETNRLWLPLLRSVLISTELHDALLLFHLTCRSTETVEDEWRKLSDECGSIVLLP